MSTPAKPSTEGGSEHQKVSGEKIFGSNNQTLVKLSNLHFTNDSEVSVKESYSK